MMLFAQSRCLCGERDDDSMRDSTLCRISVTHHEGSPFLMFAREAEAVEAWEVAGRVAA